MSTNTIFQSWISSCFVTWISSKIVSLCTFKKEAKLFIKFMHFCKLVRGLNKSKKFFLGCPGRLVCGQYKGSLSQIFLLVFTKKWMTYDSYCHLFWPALNHFDVGSHSPKNIFKILLICIIKVGFLNFQWPFKPLLHPYINFVGGCLKLPGCTLLVHL